MQKLQAQLPASTSFPLFPCKEEQPQPGFPVGTLLLSRKVHYEIIYFGDLLFVQDMVSVVLPRQNM